MAIVEEGKPRLRGFFDAVFGKLDLSPYDFSNPEISELERPMIKMLAHLVPNIKNGKYSLLVGDFNSGEIPTRVWENVINSFYKRLGIAPITTTHALRESDAISETTTARLQNLARQAVSARPGTSILISTEHVGSGVHVKDIAGIFEQIGIPYDIATVSIGEDDPNIYKIYAQEDGKPPIRQDAQLIFGYYALSNPITHKSWLRRQERDITLLSNLLTIQAHLI